MITIEKTNFPETRKVVLINKFPNGELNCNINQYISEELLLESPNDEGFDVTEHHLQITGLYQAITITFEQKQVDHDEVMMLFLIVNAIRNHSEYHKNIKINLVMPFLPYARQDRKTHDGVSISNKVFINMINSLNFDKVVVNDIHSDSSKVLFTDGTLFEQEQAKCFIAAMQNHADFFDKPDKLFVFISPDAGAYKKTFDTAMLAKETFKLRNVEIISAQKHRDTTTGKINHTSIHLPEQLFSYPYVQLIVVDDICDGGHTFIELGKAIQNEIEAKNKSSVIQRTLYVTHGLFTNGRAVVEPFYDLVVSYD